MKWKQQQAQLLDRKAGAIGFGSFILVYFSHSHAFALHLQRKQQRRVSQMERPCDQCQRDDHCTFRSGQSEPKQRITTTTTTTTVSGFSGSSIQIRRPTCLSTSILAVWRCCRTTVCNCVTRFSCRMKQAFDSSWMPSSTSILALSAILPRPWPARRAFYIESLVSSLDFSSTKCVFFKPGLEACYSQGDTLLYAGVSRDDPLVGFISARCRIGNLTLVYCQ